MAWFEVAVDTPEVGMTRRVPLLLFFLILLIAPLPLPAADAEFRVELLTPVFGPWRNPLSADLPEVKAGFPAVALGLFSNDLAGVAGDNRCGVLLHFDRASWESYGYSAGSLLAAWRQTLGRTRTRTLFASLYAGPTWISAPADDPWFNRESGFMDPVWSVTPPGNRNMDQNIVVQLFRSINKSIIFLQLVTRSYVSRTRFRPAFPRRNRSAGSLSRWANCMANPLVSPGATSSPLVAWVISSGMPVIHVVTHGISMDMASISTTGRPSAKLARTNMSADR